MAAKAQFIGREELYDLVWKEPRSQLAKRFGISDVAIAKACRKADIPMPPRGYWARKQTGKTTRQVLFPPRKPGKDEDIRLGGSIYDGRWRLSDQQIRDLELQPPVFDLTLEEVRDRIRHQLGKVTQPRSLKNVHLLIAKLLEEDEKRRVKAESSQYGYVLDKPLFDTSAEKRRLRILSGLFKGVTKCSAKPYINSKDAKEFGVQVGDQRVSLALELLNKGKRAKKKSAKPSIRFRLSIINYSYGKTVEKKSWEDTDDEKIEAMLRDIAEEVILAGEQNYREYKESRYQWAVKRKQELEEAEQARIEEEARLERERIENLRQERIQKLLGDAAAYRQACDIREYVDKVLSAVDEPSIPQQLQAWARWARNQADDLDPIVSRSFQIE